MPIDGLRKCCAHPFVWTHTSSHCQSHWNCFHE